LEEAFVEVVLSVKPLQGMMNAQWGFSIRTICINAVVYGSAKSK